MKIKVISKSYDEVMTLPRPAHKKPKKPNIFFRTLERVLSAPDLCKVGFKYTGTLPSSKDGPYLVLMNHSSFIDLKIANKILYPRPFGIICAHDALIGKEWLMRQIGCTPTRKFVSDLALIHDIKYLLDKGTNVLMYPEAGYSFDGKATVLPSNFAKLVKMLGAPVVFIEAKGAFARDPLYNGLQLRRVPVTAHVSTLILHEDIANLSVEQMAEKINAAFSFDNFAWQKENAIKVTEDFRADGLERILYKCAHCGVEGKMTGKGIKLSCAACEKSYTLTELGELAADDGNTEFSHVPDWYDWQRNEVKREILSDEYCLDIPVEIGMLIDHKALYNVGDGRLTHTPEGFTLTGCDGKLEYTQKARSSYTLNADFYWYEIGDVISIGDQNALYYCFPKENIPVAKVRLATEELYKLHQDSEFHLKHCGDCDHPAHSDFKKDS